MGGRISEKQMLAAAKPLKTVMPAGAAAAASKAMPDSSSTTNLEKLFRDQHDRVFRAAYRVTGSAADAEDVLQTVFLRLARGAEELPNPDNPESYFARAAVNAALDLLRARKRSNAVTFDEVEQGGAALELVSRNPEAKHADRELRELIRAAVSRLGSTAGQMFALRYFEGYDNGEIARMMKTSALVVGVTLHRARTRLRKEIGIYLQRHESSWE